MKNKLLTILLIFGTTASNAQKTSNASFMKAHVEKTDVCVPFRYNDAGVKTPIEWGLDMAWLDEVNVRTGIFYTGKELIDIIRLSYQPTASVENGQFTTSQKNDLNKRITAVKNWCKSDVTYNINCDHPSVDAWYNDASLSSNGRALRWAKLIDMTADYYKSKGLTNLVSISPFNEPDFGWDQGLSSSRMDDMKAICKLFKEDEAYKEKYADVRICGGNTLNDDKAYEWWNYLKDYLDEGNTHQLAGSFKNYADFFSKVRAAGHHATADELHNTTEAMVGVEYGMQTGIWWGTCERTRSEFMKATYHKNPGDRLAYAEHRNNWTSASVYRQADGRVQAFGGTSERQAATTIYKFTSLDNTVWYDGVRGRDYTMNVAGGTGYQNGQTGFETVVNIQSGEDIMPYINGVYKIVNVNSGKVLSAASNAPTGWQSIKQSNNNKNNPVSQQWCVTPYDKTSHTGDRAYHVIELNSKNKGIYIDIKDWNLNNGAEVGTYPGGFGAIEQWYLEYAGDNSFYIRSRYNTKCIEVKNNSTMDGAVMLMSDIANKPSQKWRFIAIDAVPDKKAPASPTNLKATPHNASIELSWEVPEDDDVKSYTILRSKDGMEYSTLCKDVESTSFIDNEAEEGQEYYYKVYAEDNSLNRGEKSEAVSCNITATSGLILNLPLTEDTYDYSENANHGAMAGTLSLTNYRQADCTQLSGTDNYIQLPYTIANHDELTISTWIYYRGGSQWQRIFDFGNGTDQYMFLTPNNGNNMQFAIKNGGEEQIVKTTPLLSTKWNHVVLTIGKEGAAIYVNGVKKAENTDINIRPSDIKPALNYIGRSQFKSDADLKAYLHDFRIYNYTMTAEEVEALATSIEAPVQENTSREKTAQYDLNGRKVTANHKGMVVEKGRKQVKR